MYEKPIIVYGNYLNNWNFWICLQDVSGKTVSLTQEACQYLSGNSAVTSSQGTALLGSRLLVVTELLSSQTEPPHVWISPSAVSSPRLTEALRFGMLEIQEHWETFLDRKDHVAEVFCSRGQLESYGTAQTSDLYSSFLTHLHEVLEEYWVVGY